jgi:hypothetical protein
MSYIFTMLIVTEMLVGVPWVSHAQEKTPPEGGSKATAAAEDDDTKFQESLNSLGLSAGYAGKCNEKNAETVETLTLQALEVGNELVQMFGTDAAFRFVFYVGIGAAGSKLDPAKCAQYLSEWQNFTKKYPELEKVGRKGKK